MVKIKVGTRVKDIYPDGEWATISQVSGSRFTVDWDSGQGGEMWWSAGDWLFDAPNDPRAPKGPIRAVRRIEPGVYGRLSVAEDVLPYVSIALTDPNGMTSVVLTHRRSFSAPELRELARVALELAEYLDAQ